VTGYRELPINVEVKVYDSNYAKYGPYMRALCPESMISDFGDNVKWGNTDVEILFLWGYKTEFIANRIR